MEGALRAGGDAPGLKLIETVLWDGTRAPRWPLHRARLERSAQALGWACPQVAPPAPEGAARLRLTLGRDGPAVWEVHPLPPAQAEWRVGLAAARYRAADPWLRIKSTRRGLQDAARAALAPGLDEVIFLNGRDEVCEGTISNVFFDRGQGLRTPPLACGLLPGVLRAAIACPEEVLPVAELPCVRLWLGNALRGLIPARFVA